MLVGYNCPAEAWSAIAVEGSLVLPANRYRADSEGNCDVVCLRPDDGSIRWTYNLCTAASTQSFQFSASIIDGRVVFHDKAGGVHCLALEDGKALWYAPPPQEGTFSTGGLVTGSNGIVYCAFNSEGDCNAGRGMVRAHDLSSGRVLWDRSFDRGINAAPAVGRLSPGGPESVVVLVSNNFMPSLPAWRRVILQLGFVPGIIKLLLLTDFWFLGTAFALDVKTGEVTWSYDVGTKQGYAYYGIDKGCVPAAFGSPSVGSDGVVYVPWAGGSTFALRDANGDGHIDRADPAEVSQHAHGWGTNSQTAIAPGLVVSASCEGLYGYVT